MIEQNEMDDLFRKYPFSLIWLPDDLKLRIFDVIVTCLRGCELW